MPRRSRKQPSPTKPLVKPPLKLGGVDESAIVAELRLLHESAEDPKVERMPADNEVYSALIYAERNAGALGRLSTDKQKDAALKRVQLWEYLRERTEIHQARAVADARGAGAEWAELASPLAVKAPSAAYNKAKRLQAATLTEAAGVPVRRTPEAVLQAERHIAQQKEAERKAQDAARKQHHIVVPAAQRLVEQRQGLVLDEDAEYWLDEVAEVLHNCTTSTQMVSLTRYLSAALRALAKQERRTARTVAITTEARLALSAAAAALG